jgi:hypothetical protein
MCYCSIYRSVEGNYQGVGKKGHANELIIILGNLNMNKMWSFKNVYLVMNDDHSHEHNSHLQEDVTLSLAWILSDNTEI